MSVLDCLSFCATPWFLHASSRFSSSARAKRWRSSYRPVVMEFSLMPLPFERDALQPHMSKETLDYHWGKHHRACVDNLNKQIIGTDLEGMELEDLYKLGYNNGNPAPYFNDAGLVWNHEFFWESIRPGGGKKPSGELLRLLERDFGSYETFVDEFKQAAATHVGSGWTWLVAMQTDPRVEGKYGKLVIEKTSNALNPLILGHIPLLTIDLWEHAYYLDFQNRLPDFIFTFINELISWDMVITRLERAKESIDLSDAIFTDEDFEDPWNPVEIEKDEEMSDDDIELDDEDVDEGMDEIS